MPRRLGASDIVPGKLDPNNRYIAGAYTVTMGSQQMGVANGPGDFECYHIAIQGASGSSFQVFVGNDFYDYVARGDINSWDPSQTMKLITGTTVYFYWSNTTGLAPSVQMFFQEATYL